MLRYFPKYLAVRAIFLYIAALLAVSIIFNSHTMAWYFMLIGCIQVVVFFYFSYWCTFHWNSCSPIKFIKNIFWTGWLVRIIWVIFSYLFYQEMTGEPFDFHASDTHFYDDMAAAIANAIRNGNFDVYKNAVNRYGFSDTGYFTSLTVIYLLINNSVFITRCIMALLGAYTAVLIYKLGRRIFNDNVGRMAAVFCMLMPMFIHYCGLHAKEVEMLFCCTLFVERVDYLLRQTKINIGNTLIVLLIGMSLFSFRTVLGVVAFLALFATLVFSSKKIIGTWKKILLGLLFLIAIMITFSDRIIVEATDLMAQGSTHQEAVMQRTQKRKNVNTFAKYAGATVFAPLIFTFPFPSLVETPMQENQQMIHASYVVKNIISIFTIYALLLLLLRKEWRTCLMPLLFMLGYLMVIALSGFAFRGRFHMPAMPFLMLFAAYGVSNLQNKHKSMYIYYMIFLFFIYIGWAWVKLAGKGII